MAKRDVQLVVRARDEASRALDTIVKSLGDLTAIQKVTSGTSTSLGTDIGALVTTLAKVERAYDLVDGAANRGEQAFKKQSSTLAATKSELLAVEAQLASAGKAIAATQQAIVNTKLDGGNTDKLVGDLKAADTSVKTLQKTQDRLRSSIGAQEAALDGQRSTLQQLGSTATATKTMLASLGDEGERAQVKLKLATLESEQALLQQASAARELVDQQRNLAKFDKFVGITSDPKGTNASKSADVFEEQNRLAQSAQRLRDKIDPLAAIQAKLNRELRDAEQLFEAGAIDATTYGAALEALKIDADQAAAALGRTGRGAKGKPSLFGLKPYELTNLGYQVNDVVTQLASGTGLMQVMAQQGGQILQLLPGIGKTLIATFTNPLVLAGIAAIGTLTVVFKKAADEANRLEEIEGFLAGIADGARYSVQEMEAMVEAVDRVGVSAAEAMKIVQGFVREGLNPEYVVLFTQAAEDTAKVTGDEIPAAMEKLKTAFSGGFDDVAKLDDKLQFLTETERAQIKVMFDSGQSAAARERAFRIFQDRMSNIAKSAKGDWSSAFESLTDSVDGLFDKLAESSVIQRFQKNFVEGIEATTYAINKATGNLDLRDIESRIAALRKEIKAIKDAEKDGDIARGATETLTPPMVAEINDLLKQRQDILKKNKDISGDIRDNEASFNKKRRAEAIAQINDELRLSKITDERQKIKLEGQRAYREELRKTGDVEIANAKKKATIDRLQFELQQKGLSEFRKPVNGPQTSGFGTRKDPITGKTKEHRGRDFGVGVGTPVVAPAAGIITSSRLGTGRQKGNGLFVVINHGKGTETLLLHLSESEVVTGQIVEAGQVIGKSGGAKGNPNSGRSTGPHLHEERRVNGVSVNPDGLFSSDVREAEKLQEKRIEDQDKFNDALNVEIEKRRASSEFQQRESTLSGNALLDAKKKFEIDKEIASKQAEAAKSEVEFTAQQRKELEASLAAEFEIAHARERANAVLESSSTERTALLERLGLAQQAGDNTLVAALQQQIEGVEEKMREGIKTAIAYYKTLNTPEANAAILNLESKQAQIANESGSRAAAIVDQFAGERNSLIESLRIARELQDTVGAGKIEGQIAGVDAEMRKAIDSAIKFYEQFNSPESRSAQTGLENLRNTLTLDTKERARDLVEKPVNDLQAQRSGLQEQIEFFKEIGQNNVVEELKRQLKEIDISMLSAIDKSIEFWRTQTGPEAQAAILQYENLRNQIIAAQQEFTITAMQIQEAFAGSLADSVQLFVDRLVETKNPLRALGEAALSFAASFLQKIGDMLLQMAALKVASQIGFGGAAGGLSSLFNAAPLVTAATGLGAAGATLTTAGSLLTGSGATLTAGGAGLTASATVLSGAGIGLTTSAGLWMATAIQLQAAATTLLLANTVGAASGGVLHGGGIAGSANRSRSVHSSWFAGAVRYHGGGLAGLKPNEVPSILERGEEVITRSDSRHRLNGGLSGDNVSSGMMPLSQVLAIGDDEIANAMAGAAGAKVTLTHIKRHAGTIRQLIGG